MNTTEKTVFGGGCFWCTEAVFQTLKGVVSVAPGYAGGSTGSPQAAPTYEEVLRGDTVELLVDMTNPGEWMAHCHIAEHLEAGMALRFTVSE